MTAPIGNDPGHRPANVPDAQPQPQSREILAAKERVDELRREVQKIYVGSPKALDMMLVSLLARGHVLLEGVPGVAKTTLVKAFATALGCSARRIQFTPDLLPADITGTYVLSPRDGTFSLRAGPIFANVVLADEINRAPAKTQSALLEAMQERQVTIEGDRFELPLPFLVLATQNPIDLEGTYPLPEAQIDRFLVRIAMGYPTSREEAQMLRTHGHEPPTLRPVLTAPDVAALQLIAARIHVEDDLHDYAVALTTFTRNHPKIALGASPRATLGLLQAGKAHAMLAARNYLVPEDLRAVAVAVLAHRLVLMADVEGEARVREQVIEEALAKVGYRRGFRAV
ncbi:MAG: methanol dehydrogenase regulatory protein [Labilithrix sp.]|nr:methanol dehydrogenase regulatory protein [Labilithrix sp.]